MANNKKSKGISLAKGPVLFVGLALLIYGVLALIFGGHGFEMDPVSGTETGKTFLGLEGNGWTNLLFIGAGALLVFGSPTHWGAKSLSLIVGLVLGAASVIALVDGDDVFGIFAANGLTTLVWGIAAAILIVLALLPRVGGNKPDDRAARREQQPVERARFERDTATPSRDRAGSVAASDTRSRAGHSER
jgi:hypothetical protein